MKKSSVLWLLPLVVALFFSVPSSLFAQTQADGGSDTASGSTQIDEDIDGGDLVGGDKAIIDDKGLIAAANEAAARQAVTNEVAARESAIKEAVANEAVAREAAITEAIANEAAAREAAIREVADKSKTGQAKSSDVWDPEYKEQIPLWVTHPEKIEEFEVVGVGTARNGTDRLSIQLADARARQDIALQVSANVKAMITDFAENQGGTANEFEVLQASRSQMIGKQLIEIDLKGVKVEQRAKALDGTWWVKVVYVDPVKKAAYDRTEQGRIKAAADAAKAAADAAKAAADANTSGTPPTFPYLNPVTDPADVDYTDRAREALDLMDKELEKANVPQSGTTVLPATEARAQPEVKVQSAEDAKEQLSKKSPLKSTVVVASE
ncbi:hypothetical protein AGMMS49579_15920 [Spirochaetia bacterium]|nr:hypothetical protein AGMMS49579_15920 [Spirochaetia bacterium]